jgi:nitrite reductase/ring-hydroxylating ferredoxin subunit
VTSPPPLRIAKLVDVPEGSGVAFTFRDQSNIVTEGFLVRFRGQLHAYVNQCRHQPLSLDYGDGEFFTDEGDLLLCRNHGALFEPDTGECVAGPCFGAHLFRLPIEEREDGVWLLASHDPPPDLE